MRNDKDNLIVDLTFKFAMAVIDYCEKLENNKKYVLARQLLKSGTSIGANVREAQNAESKADLFINLKLQQRKQTKLNIGSCSVKNQNTTLIRRNYWMNYKASFVSFLKSLAHLNHNLQIIKFSNQLC